MRPDWEVKTSSQAVKFLSRVFKHLMQLHVSPTNTAALQIVINAQGDALDAILKEAS